MLHNTADSFVSDLSFRTFQDQGLILNTNGFSGTIEVANSTFTANIAYIQQVLIYEYQTGTDFYSFDSQEMLIQFSNQDQTYLQFKQCVDQTWTSRYLFNEVIDPDQTFDDSIVVDMIENVAAFMIKGNRGPVIFSGNTFRDNIGTTGGVIHIEDPDFRFGDSPSIVMSENQFVENMAYWAGNAFHIQMKVRMINAIDSEHGPDVWQTCGAGILIQDNFFQGNIGLKRHNGGAGVIRCQHSTDTTDDMFTFLSGK